MKDYDVFKEKCAELEENDKKIDELLKESKRFGEMSRQCKEEGDLRLAKEYLQASLKIDYEAKALIEEYIRMAEEVVEEYGSEALDELDALADD